VRHPYDLVSISGKSFFPKCEMCWKQINPATIGHRSTKFCKMGQERKVQREKQVKTRKVLKPTIHSIWGRFGKG